MKYNVRIEKDGEYRPLHIYTPPMSLLGLIFEWDKKYYKVIDIMYQASSKQLTHDDFESLPKVTVTEIPVICP